MTMADAALFVIVSRAVERLAVVAAGTVCIWCGYKLFGSVATNDATATFKFGNNAISLTKIGPGVLFAGFGIGLLWKCISAVITVGSTTDTPKKRASSSPALIFGLPQGRGQIDTVRLKNDIAVLNALAPAVPPPGLDQPDVERALHQARVALLAQSWDPSWGDEDAMRGLAEGRVPSAGPVSELYNARLHDDFR
jgi:hypothetical protein